MRCSWARKHNLRHKYKMLASSPLGAQDFLWNWVMSHVMQNILSSDTFQDTEWNELIFLQVYLKIVTTTWISGNRDHFEDGVNNCSKCCLIDRFLWWEKFLTSFLPSLIFSLWARQSSGKYTGHGVRTLLCFSCASYWSQRD